MITKPSSVKTCWIAEVKRDMGLTTRPAWNRGQGKGTSPCPKYLRPHIQAVLEDNPHATYKEIQEAVLRRVKAASAD